MSDDERRNRDAFIAAAFEVIEDMERMRINALFDEQMVRTMYMEESIRYVMHRTSKGIKELCLAIFPDHWEIQDSDNPKVVHLRCSVDKEP